MPNDLRGAVLPHDTLWAIDETAGRQLWMMLQHTPAAEHVAAFQLRLAQPSPEPEASGGYGTSQAQKPFDMIGNTAILRLSGPMTKQTTSLSAGTSTVRLRRQVRQASADPDVKSILLVVDSPGGSVSGTADLADDISKAAAKKPLYAYCEDCCASAAMWTAAQGARVYANRTALVGSIGTVMVLYDMSRMAASEGVDVLVFSTGQYKGAGTPGTVITDAHKAYFQQMVDGLNAHFLQAIATGRRLPLAAVKKFADGRMFHADQAVKMGLIDGVSTLDDVLDMLAAAEADPNYGQSPAVLPDDDDGGDPDDAAGSRASGFNDNGREITAEDQPMNAWELLQQTMSKINLAAKGEAGQASAETPAAVDPAVNARLQALEDENRQLKADNDAVVAVAAANAAAEAAKVTLAANVARVDAAVKAMKLVPVAATQFKALAADHPEAFDQAMKAIEASPAIAALAGGTNAADLVEANAAAAGADNAAARLEVLTQTYMKAHAGVKHHEAMTMVARDNPELATAAYEQSRTS